MGVGPLNSSTRAVFLDRDGVLNRAVIRNGLPHPPRSLAELEILPGVREALVELKATGFLLLVVTNQPDVNRGAQSRQVVEAMNARLKLELAIDHFYVCCHIDEEACTCRKPQPGMLLQAGVDYHVDLAASFMIGDRWRDIDAGHHAGCRSILIDYGYRERNPSLPPNAVVPSLGAAARWILQQSPVGVSSGSLPRLNTTSVMPLW